MSANLRRPATIAEIEAALSSIPAQEREVWVQVGMAIKAELGDAGYPIWDYWSQTADNYHERDARDVWKSFKQGGVSLATLFYYARLHGWAAEKIATQNASVRPRSSTKA